MAGAHARPSVRRRLRPTPPEIRRPARPPARPPPHRSCVALAAPMEPIALERWLALGGTGRTHDVTVLPAAAGGMDGMELVAPGHGFRLWTDAGGATWLAGAAEPSRRRLSMAAQRARRGGATRVPHVEVQSHAARLRLARRAGHRCRPCRPRGRGRWRTPIRTTRRGLAPRRRPHHRLGRLHLQPVRSRLRHCRQPDQFRSGGGGASGVSLNLAAGATRGRLGQRQLGGGPGAERRGRRRRALGGRPDAGRRCSR